jgi:hypothetical protein
MPVTYILEQFSINLMAYALMLVYKLIIMYWHFFFHHQKFHIHTFWCYSTFEFVYLKKKTHHENWCCRTRTTVICLRCIVICFFLAGLSFLWQNIANLYFRSCCAFREEFNILNLLSTIFWQCIIIIISVLISFWNFTVKFVICYDNVLEKSLPQYL